MFTYPHIQHIISAVKLPLLMHIPKYARTHGRAHIVHISAKQTDFMCVGWHSGWVRGGAGDVVECKMEVSLHQKPL